jgi:hypothetical protein
MKMARRGRDRCGGGGFDCLAARSASAPPAAVRLSSSSTSTDGNDAASVSSSGGGGGGGFGATGNGTAAVAAPMDPASSLSPLSTSGGVVQGDQVSERTRMTTNSDGASAAASSSSSSYAMSHDAGSLLDIDPSAVEIVAVETATSSSSSRKPTGDDDDAAKQATGTGQQQGDTVRSTSPSPPSTSSSSASSSSTSTTSDSAAASFLRQLPFVSMFRNSANYIANHRGTTAVYHIPGTLLDLEDPNMFRDLMNDVALTWLLGMKIVLVVGCRHQIERRIGTILGLRDDDRLYGLRVTNEETLRIVKEEAGYVRFEVERQLARSLRVQGTGTAAGATTAQTGASSGAAGNKFGYVMVNGAGGGGGAAASASHAGGGEHSTMSPSGGGDGGYYDGNVVSGNFYSAQPFGILDGVDYST